MLGSDTGSCARALTPGTTPRFHPFASGSGIFSSRGPPDPSDNAIFAPKHQTPASPLSALRVPPRSFNHMSRKHSHLTRFLNFTGVALPCTICASHLPGLREHTNN